jgi:hypothetical protein
MTMILILIFIIFPLIVFIVSSLSDTHKENTRISSLNDKSNEGDPNAQLQLALSYFRKYGKGSVTGDELLHMAAEGGSVRAQEMLSSSYYACHNLEKFYTYTKLAANNGSIDCQSDLGWCYKFGKGTIIDYEKAAYWSEKAAIKEDRRAQYDLADLYFNGDGVERNIELQYYWMFKSAKNGCPNAQYQLGFDYYNGWGLPKDYERAVYYINKAKRYKSSATREKYSYIEANEFWEFHCLHKYDESKKKGIEIKAMNYIKAYEKSNNRNPIDVSSDNLGYDIESSNTENVRFIEVKGKGIEGDVLMTDNEWQKANELGNTYFLYVVLNCFTDTPKLFIAKNPSKLTANYNDDEKKYIISYETILEFESIS